MNRTNPSAKRREQRERQKAYRDEMRAIRKPGRDDIARVWLWRTMRDAMKSGPETVDEIHCRMVKTLIGQGFDERQCDIAIDELFHRYAKERRPPFRKKRHLQRQDAPAPEFDHPVDGES